MLAIVGASGKLGFATLNALLDYDLIPAEDIICTTSSDSGAQKLEPLQQKGVQVRRAHWDDQESFEDAFKGCAKLFLISSSRVLKDFGDAPSGQGREADHFVALEAARKVGVEHVYYSSLAFANPSKSRVMKAHERTEEWLRKSVMKYTLIREGLYNESWPLYLGHYSMPNDEGRTEIPIAGDSKISWTSISDLGVANALILAAPSKEWDGKVPYLSQSESYTLAEVAEMVTKARGKQVGVKVVSREEHEKYYVEQRGMDEQFVKWWSKTYDALNDNECQIQDPTLEKLLESKGVKPKPMVETAKDMLA